MSIFESSSSTSASLLKRVRQFDAQAWERLTKLYGPMVYRWSRKAGLQENDAADLVQNVFQAVAGNIGKFRRDQSCDSFRGWLWTITRNKVRDFFRDRATRPLATGGSDAQQILNNSACNTAPLPTRPSEICRV